MTTLTKIRLPETLRSMWIDALRSGMWEQIHGALVVAYDRSEHDCKSGCCCWAVVQALVWDCGSAADLARLYNYPEPRESGLPPELLQCTDFAWDIQLLNDGTSGSSVERIKQTYQGLDNWDGEALSFYEMADFLAANTEGV